MTARRAFGFLAHTSPITCASGLSRRERPCTSSSRCFSCRSALHTFSASQLEHMKTDRGAPRAIGPGEGRFEYVLVHRKTRRVPQSHAEGRGKGATLARHEPRVEGGGALLAGQPCVSYFFTLPKSRCHQTEGVSK